MSVFLGQLPPAEIARLKAELAETLIAHFCYPRFFDYRTESLVTRPVDRAKRQEVWLYLSSVDFTAWNRVDLMTPNFQHHIERLFIHFVQRNRSFFGEQGRKRMGDIRMLIGSSALSVSQRLREHLSGNPSSDLPFGSPRPVCSWSTMKITNHPERSWDQIVSPTLLLQQQIQEARGEIKPAPSQSEMRPAATTMRRSNRLQPKPGYTTNGIEHQATSATPIPVKSAPQANARAATTPTRPKSTSPLNPGRSTSNVSPASAPGIEPVIPPLETPLVPPSSTAVPVKPSEAGLPASEVVQPPVTSTLVEPQVIPQVAAEVPASSHDSMAVLIAEEDITIFDQLRYQLILWLRIEGVRAGLDISNQGPAQLLELLRKQDKFDETHLQVISTLLDLSNQVIKNRQASIFDYKQALMFHLMHTKR